MSGTDGAGGPGAEDRDLVARIEQRLAEEAGIYAAVRVADGVIYLDGMVESAEQREAASDLAQGAAGSLRVQNDLDIEQLDAAREGVVEAPNRSMLADTTYQMGEGPRSELIEPLEPNYNQPIPDIGGDMTTDSMVAVEEGIPYMPPTDPVVRPANSAQDLEIVGGFGATSIEEFPDQLAETALGDAPAGDEDIRSQVLEALATDAATIDLLIEVVVRNGVVRLRGRVPTLDDAEMAEEVAARVPEVREVIEELEVAALE